MEIDLSCPSRTIEAQLYNWNADSESTTSTNVKSTWIFPMKFVILLTARFHEKAFKWNEGRYDDLDIELIDWLFICIAVILWFYFYSICFPLFPFGLHYFSGILIIYWR